jgi:hypothetical protein
MVDREERGVQIDTEVCTRQERVAAALSQSPTATCVSVTDRNAPGRSPAGPAGDHDDEVVGLAPARCVVVRAAPEDLCI